MTLQHLKFTDKMLTNAEYYVGQPSIYFQLKTLN